MPDEDAERCMYEDTLQILKEYGYHRYEISNYAREGYECRHNLGYWERKEYLGLGTGAASLIREQRFHHISDTREYIENAHDPELLVCDREELSVREQMEEFMFLGLRKMKGVCLERFRETFGCSMESVYGEVIKRMTKDGLLTEGQGRVCLTEKGIDISNYVLAQFLLDETSFSE